MVYTMSDGLSLFPVWKKIWDYVKLNKRKQKDRKSKLGVRPGSRKRGLPDGENSAGNQSQEIIRTF